MPSKAFARLFLNTACLSFLAFANAKALDYPTRPARIIVGFVPGGATDIFAQLLFASWLSDKLGQQFIVENRPGAANNIGTSIVVKALPDGYTFCWCKRPISSTRCSITT